MDGCMSYAGWESPLMCDVQSTVLLIHGGLHYSFFPTWWMVTGMWDYIDNRWLMGREHLSWLTFSPKGSNSFLTPNPWRERRPQKHLSRYTPAFIIICPPLTHAESVDGVSDCFFFPPVSQFNFVGKLLGPRGNSMKRLQEETGVKMSILGKGSMRDKDKVRREMCRLVSEISIQRKH